MAKRKASTALPVANPTVKLTDQSLPDEGSFKSASGVKTWFSSNWVGVFISLVALCTAIYSSYQTRVHYRLSVRPSISLSFNANDEGAGWIRTVSGGGPAIINAFEVAVDGKPVQTWDSVLIALGIDPVGVTGKLSIPVPGIYLQPGTSATNELLWIKGPPAARAALVKNSGRVQLKLTFCSLYDECWARASGEYLEAIPVEKQKPTMAFGVSERWKDSFSPEIPIAPNAAHKFP